MGCGLFTPDSTGKRTATSLPPLRPAPTAIGLRYTFVERPVGDPLLGREIWNDVSENLAGNDPELMKNLQRNGFRIGLMSSYSDSLQKLISRPGEEFEVGLNGEKPGFAGKSLFVRHSEPFLINSGDRFPVCDLTVFRERDDDQPEVLTMKDAHCLFKVTALKEQDGWASLSFLPEILHGIERVRPIAGENSWEPSFTQETETLYGQKFKLQMNVGDTAIITSRENAPGTAGYYFFRGSGSNSDIQRALLIRLVHVPTSMDLAANGNSSLR